ncbi:MAG TPA: hypothetical protein VEI02_02535 [Planctomycetota bacterium]|nr:hypothetical protein [Planctomycetota bacterium]
MGDGVDRDALAQAAWVTETEARHVWSKAEAAGALAPFGAPGIDVDEAAEELGLRVIVRFSCAAPTVVLVVEGDHLLIAGQVGRSAFFTPMPRATHGGLLGVVKKELVELAEAFLEDDRASAEGCRAASRLATQAARAAEVALQLARWGGQTSPG